MITAFEVSARDGTVLRGEIRTGRSDLVVLVHALGHDLDVWRDTATALESDGLAVVTYDLRGHGGSDGAPDPEQAAHDLEDVVGYATAHCAGRLLLVTDGDSSRAALAVAAAREPAGLVLLSPLSLQGLEAATAVPKLLVLGADSPVDGEAALAEGQLTGYSFVIRLPVEGSLLEGKWRTTVVDYIVRFLREARLRSPRQEVPR